MEGRGAVLWMVLSFLVFFGVGVHEGVIVILKNQRKGEGGRGLHMSLELQLELEYRNTIAFGMDGCADA